MFRSEPGSRENTSSVFGRAVFATRDLTPLAREHQERFRPCRVRHARFDVVQLPLDPIGQRVRLRFDADAGAQHSHGLRDVGKPAMRIREIGDLCPIELRSELRLRAVDDDEIGTHRDDPFDIGIEERAHSRQLLHFGRELIVAADRGNPIARAHGEQHLGGRRDDRHDPSRLSLQRDRDAEQHGERE
jgi:hypothetical protein